MAIVAKRDLGQSIESICRTHQISPATFSKWKREFEDGQDDDKRRLRQSTSIRRAYWAQRLPNKEKANR